MGYPSRMLRALVGICVLSACSRAPSDPPPPVAVSASAVPAPPPSVSAPEPAPIASASAPAPVPAVEVRAIGMHIGGGPNDDANKAPLLASIAPHHAALARCWGSLAGKPRVELGVDAHVPGKGGRAKIDHPRSTVKDAAFVDCAVTVFTAIEFLPPKSGLDTTVSASLRFTPRREATGSE